MTADPVEAIFRLAEDAGAVGPAAASAEALRQALSLQRAGQLEQAETIYQMRPETIAAAKGIAIGRGPADPPHRYPAFAREDRLL